MFPVIDLCTSVPWTRMFSILHVLGMRINTRTGKRWPFRFERGTRRDIETPQRWTYAPSLFEPSKINVTLGRALLTHGMPTHTNSSFLLD